MAPETLVDFSTKRSEGSSENPLAMYGRIFVAGTYTESSDQSERAAYQQLGTDLGEAGVQVIVGAVRGFPGLVAHGVMNSEGDGTVLVAAPKGREHDDGGQDVALYNTGDESEFSVTQPKGRSWAIDTETFDGNKDLFFNSSVDAILLLPPSNSLGTIEEAIIALNRMTYYQGVAPSHLVPIIFIGPQWNEPRVPLDIDGKQVLISDLQFLKSRINLERQVQGESFKKDDYIFYADTPKEALEILKTFAANKSVAN